MPASPSAPPPAAPAAAPAPSQASAPAAPPAAAPGRPADPVDQPSWLDGVGKDIEGLDADRPQPKQPEAKTADDALAKTGEVVPPKKPDEKAVEQPPDQPVKPVKAAELRTAYDNLKKEKREVLEPKIQQLESKIKELEARQPEDTKPLLEKMTAAEKRAAELEQHIQFVDYEKSQEFQTKYHQPYVEAWTKAVADFGQLIVRVPDGTDDATGEPKFSTRQATADDLLYLANLPLSQMDDQAEALFGKSAARVIRHIERVQELSEAKNKALSEAQKKSGEWAKTRQFQMQQFQQQQHTLWTEYNKQIAERFPQMFGPVDGDDEGNALLTKGYEQADRLFAPANGVKPQTTEERIQFHALLRNKIANHDRLARRLRMVNTELEETKKSLEAYEKSEPPAGKGGNAKPAAKGFMAEVDAELEKLDKP